MKIKRYIKTLFDSRLWSYSVVSFIMAIGWLAGSGSHYGP